VTEPEPTIIVVDRERIEPARLACLVEHWFKDMVKLAVDARTGAVAVGGEFHADGEQILLERGSLQADIWGANYYPGRPRDQCVECLALINIRPSQGNRSMSIEDLELRRRVLDVAYARVVPEDHR
jgi:hypothetical protein